MTRPMVRVSASTSALMALAAVTFALASTIHFGIGLASISDPFPGAATPEAIIAVVLAIGAAVAATRTRPSWWVAVATTAFAILGTVLGLSITARGGVSGDVLYHAGILVVLLAIGALLLARDRRA